MAIERRPYTSPPGRGAYAIELARWPSVWGTFLGAVVTAGLAGAVALPLVATVVGAVWLGAGNRRLRARLDADAERRAREQRYAAREARLDGVSASTFGYRAAGSLVADIAATDARLARTLDLEGLLDRYVDLAVAGARCRRVLTTHDRYEMIRALGRTSVRSPLRRQLIERRLAAWDACRLQLQAVEEQLAEITELLLLLSERVRFANAEIDVDADLVDARIALVDD